MSNRKILFISSTCKYSKDILVGFKEHPFLVDLFDIVNINTDSYPPYIKSVPSLLIGADIIKGSVVFEYFGKLVDEKLKQENRIENKNTNESDTGQCRINDEGELEGWCSSGSAIDFSLITENNDNNTNSIHKFNTNLEFLNNNNNSGPINNQVKSMEAKDNKLAEKRSKFDADFERLQSSRNNIM